MCSLAAGLGGTGQEVVQELLVELQSALNAANFKTELKTQLFSKDTSFIHFEILTFFF